MKIIHSSDWHLGHQLYNFDREKEQLSMLKQIEDIVRREQADALIVSGDVYHTAQPSAAIQKMFTEAIVKIHNACPSMYIIVTAGNHDSGTKHEIFRTPWEALNVFVIGQLDKDNQKAHIIKVKDKGIVIAVPYVNTRNLSQDFYKQIVSLAKQEYPNLPIVLMAHTTVQGVNWSGHESSDDKIVGGIEAIPIQDFGEDFDYLALGHIHKSQFIPGSKDKIRYSGSPLPVSFDETFNHSVSVVELFSDGTKAKIREVEIFNPRPLITLPLEGALEWNEVREILKNFKPELQETYLRIAVKVEDFLPHSASFEAAELANKCGCRFCYILTSREEHKKADSRSLNIDEFQRESPEDIAKRYAEDRGFVWDEELQAMFKEVVDIINEEKRSEI